jgi:hypothetical protein
LAFQALRSTSGLSRDGDRVGGAQLFLLALRNAPLRNRRRFNLLDIFCGRASLRRAVCRESRALRQLDNSKETS